MKILNKLTKGYIAFTISNKLYWINLKFPFLHFVKKVEYWERYPFGYAFIRKAILYILKHDPEVCHVICKLVHLESGHSITVHPDKTVEFNGLSKRFK